MAFFDWQKWSAINQDSGGIHISLQHQYIRQRLRSGAVHYRMVKILKQKYWVFEIFKHSLKTQGEKLNNSSKKLKVSANPLGLLAENRSNKKAWGLYLHHIPPGPFCTCCKTSSIRSLCFRSQGVGRSSRFPGWGGLGQPDRNPSADSMFGSALSDSQIATFSVHSWWLAQPTDA